MRFFRVIFQSFFLTVHVVVAILFLLSAFSDRISPESFMPGAYLGLGFPVFCILNLCLTCYWLFTKERRFVWIGLLSALPCWGQVKLYFPFHSRADGIPRENTIKILTYNIMSFGYKPHTKENPNPTIGYIARSGADIVCLQEYAEDTQGKFLTREKIYKELDMYPYRSIVYLKRARRLRYGIAVFSKYPIEKSRRINYDSQFNASTMHTIRVKDKKVTLVNNHLESFKLTSEDRSRYASLIKEMDSESLGYLKGTIQQKLGAAFKIRAVQARSVAKAIAGSSNEYTVVCGDFNDTPVSYAHHTIGKGLIDAFSASGRGMGVSYNENLFWFRIDHILCSPNIRPYNCTVEHVGYSDHYPMWCYLQLE